MKSDDVLTFIYRFVISKEESKDFNIVLDRLTLQQMNKNEGPYPEWAGLDFNKCANCPLDVAEHPHCPVAVSLIDTVEYFKNCISFDEVDVYLKAPNRDYMTHISMQEGLSSMIGLLMATSGCPHMEMLKPMARFHLPFAEEDETMYRVITMYLMAQYFVNRRGGAPDWELKNLAGMYDNIRTVNKHFVQRLSKIKIKDASLNALIKLDCFAISVAFTIDQNLMEEYESLFGAFLD
jgi:hypothetical protein